MLKLENIAYILTFLGFFSGLVTGWNVRDRKAQDDHQKYVAYMADSVEGRMKRDGWSA